jgi:putative transposase
MLPRRPRLNAALYIGFQRYFLTFCTAQRREEFVAPEPVDLVLQQILQSGRELGMDVIAYTFMRDHVHLLVEALGDATNAAAFVHRSKQRSGYAFSRKYHRRLWQPSYFDRVLRDDDSVIAVVRYIVENPIRRGYVKSADEYPFSGSDRYTMDQIMEAARWQP